MKPHTELGIYMQDDQTEIYVFNNKGFLINAI